MAKNKNITDNTFLQNIRFSICNAFIVTNTDIIGCMRLSVATLDPHYYVLRYKVDSVKTRLKSWILIFQGLAKFGY